MRRSFVRCLIGAALIWAATPALSQARPFLYGQVRWQSGPAAQGLEVRLKRGNQTVAATFTDRRGLYAFQAAPGKPSDFRVVVVSARATLADIQVPRVAPGSMLPPIILR